MEPLNVRDVIAATRGVAGGALPDQVIGVSTDTRTLRPGDLFVALRGGNFDGHHFLAEAQRRGATAALVEQGQASASPLPSIAVASPEAALLQIGALHRARLNARVVAITGSCGKTTTKDLTACALGSRFNVVASPSSFNNAIGVPLTLFQADKTTDVVVLEVGTNAPGEIAALAAVAQPDVAVITNIGTAHLEGLRSVEGVLQEKGSLLDHVRPGGVAILNGDDDAHLERLRARAKCRVATTGVRRRAQYMATMPLCEIERVAFHFNGRERVRVPLLGCHNLYNALSALAICVELGVSVEAAAERLRGFVGPPMRMKKQRIGDWLVIDDAYNANPGSMKAAIKTLASLSITGRRIIVLGDMLELGDASEELHRDVGRSLACGHFDLVAGVGTKAQAILDGALERGLREEQLLRYADTEHCALDLPARLEPHDTILIKGSRRMALERVVKALAGCAAVPVGSGTKLANQSN